MDYVLITGVSSGIGNALAKKFLAEGYGVFGSIRTQQDAEKIQTDLGPNFHPLIFDVTDQAGIDAAVREVERILKGGGLAGLINNAGIAVGGTVIHLPVSEFRRQFDVNVFAMIAVTKAFLPLLGAMKKYPNRPGKIFNISSVSGKVAYPFIGAYCASKFAVEGFTESLRRELLPYGIDAITICPGPVKTPIWSKSRVLDEAMLHSDYGPALERFGRFVEGAEKNGLEPDDLANRIYRVFIKKRPKATYVFLKNKFLNYTFPRIFLTPRIVDGFLQKLYR